MRMLGWVLDSSRRYRWALRMGRWVQRLALRDGWIARVPGYASGWTLGRDLQALPEESFREWWARRQGEGPGAGMGGPTPGEGSPGGSGPGPLGARSEGEASS